MNGGWRTTQASAQDANGVLNSDQPTSRAMNLSAEKTEVVALCAKHKAEISAIEELPAGGTRLVLVNADAAAVMRKAFKSKLIDANVARTLWVRNS